MSKEASPNSRVVLSIFLIVISGLAQAATITVGPGQDHDFKTIQDGIDAAAEGDTVIVADGTYTGPGNRFITFRIKAITVRSMNGPENCIIDCQNNGQGFSFHREGRNSVLDGFTITNASTAGIVNNNANPTIVNCILRANSAGWGGGGMLNYSSSPAITNCTFEGNSSSQDGGGMSNESSSPILTNCTFRDNSAGDDGGGMCNRLNSHPTLINCTFTGNSAADDGGAIGNYDRSNPTILRCSFVSNSSEDNGGAVFSRYDSNPAMLGCTFLSNFARSNGAAIYNRQNDAIMVNCIFSGNSAHDSGGAMFNREGAEPMLLNCTFTANSANFDGGAIMNDRSHPRMLNCILYDNSDRSGNGESAQINVETLEVNYCCIQGWSGQWAGAGNMGLNPHFVDADGADGIVGTLDDDLRLAVDSPCIDTGAGSNLIEPVQNDCRGNPRIINGTIDMGAYEFVLGDTDGDDDIDMEDFAAFAAQWLKTQCGACGGADLTDDGDVRADDLYKLASGWLAGRNRAAPAWTPETVVINEILTNSPSGAFDWIELHNTSDESINISGWFLSDNSGRLRKFEIADETWIAPGAYLVFSESTDFGNSDNPGCHQSFALRGAGEIVCLSSGHGGVLTGYRQKQIFEASENDVSLGRYYKSTGSFDFVTLAEKTPGSANAYPKISPIVISELMYDPQPGEWEDEEEEYIELYNRSDSLVTFTQYPRWKLNNFYIPNFSDPDISIPPHGYLLVIHDLEEFTARYGSMPPGVQVLNYNTPFLNDYNATIKLLMGDILVDSVTYSNSKNPWMFPDGIDPWPAGLLEQGASLTRIFPEKYGNDPNNWQAAAPTPGH